MKKTLAIILALIMLLSVALVSCSKEGKETGEPTDDFWGNVEDTDPDDENNSTETDAQGNQISSSDYHTNANGDV